MAISHLMRARDEWSGTATELLGVLAKTAGDDVARAKGWPGTSQLLSGRVSRAAPFLRGLGITIDRVKIGRSRTRVIRITVDSAGERESRGNPSSASSASPEEARMCRESHLQTIDGCADDGRCSPTEIVPVEVAETASLNDADDADDDFTAISDAKDKGYPDRAGGDFDAFDTEAHATLKLGPTRRTWKPHRLTAPPTFPFLSPSGGNTAAQMTVTESMPTTTWRFPTSSIEPRTRGPETPIGGGLIDAPEILREAD